MYGDDDIIVIEDSVLGTLYVYDVPTEIDDRPTLVDIELPYALELDLDSVEWR